MGDKSEVLEAVLKEAVDLVIHRSESITSTKIPCFVFLGLFCFIDESVVVFLYL